MDINSYKDRRYDIVGYDPAWSEQFERYSQKIKGVFGNDIQIEHIRSTSILGMAGKSCIDVLVIVNDVKNVEEHVKEMTEAGFEYAGQFLMEGSRLFRVMKGRELAANIHFFVDGHSHIAEMIQLRDYLRRHPEEVRAYSNLKAELKSKFPEDYASYRKGKDEYIRTLIKRVL